LKVEIKKKTLSASIDENILVTFMFKIYKTSEIIYSKLSSGS